MIRLLSLPLKFSLFLLILTETLISQKFDPQKKRSRYYESIILLKQNGYCQHDFNELLGHGIYGEAWGSTEHNLAIKVKKVSGRFPKKYIREFNKQLYIYDALQLYAPDQAFKERITTLKPENFALIKDSIRTISIFSMERLRPIHNAKNNELTRIRLGLHPLRTYQEIETLVNTYPSLSAKKTNMEQLCYDLGTLFAIIQLGAKMDCFDTELYLARQSKNSDRYRIVLIDFHLTRDLQSIFINTDEKSIIYNLLRGIRTRELTPPPSTPGFNQFKEGYLNFALTLDTLNNEIRYVPLALQLFEEYARIATKKTI